jgi:hypothetical protein
VGSSNSGYQCGPPGSQLLDVGRVNRVTVDPDVWHGPSSFWRLEHVAAAAADAAPPVAKELRERR